MRRTVSLRAADTAMFTDGVRAVEAELQVPTEFSDVVLAEAAEAARSPQLPDRDLTDVPFVTIDPPGSMDLDQALHVTRRGRGYRVSYAIADVSAFVTPGGAVDEEAHRRGETLYAPDHRIPLYPSVLGEGAASLLPDGPRPALVWTVDLDRYGDETTYDVMRAIVRSRERCDYETVQHRLDDGTADESLQLVAEVGRLRLRREAERGAVNLQLPEQRIEVDDAGWALQYRKLLPIERWNEQISLLTGMACAEIMLYGEVGIVRTLPEPTTGALARLRRTAAALHLPWPAELDYPGFVRSLDPNTGIGAAMLNACASLLRGAGYMAFDGGVPNDIEHSALASEYTHATAPLRRLVDKYCGEIAVSLCADEKVPDWVLIRMHDLPKEMATAQQRSHSFDGAVMSFVEAGVLQTRVGETFTGVVTEVDQHRPDQGMLMVREPAVEARVVSAAGTPLPLGATVHVRLAEADPARRLVRFELP